MKKILLSLFILFMPVCLWSGGVLFMAGGVESGDTHEDIGLFIGFEGNFAGSTYTIGADDYSAGDQTGTAVSTATVNTDAAIIGSNGLDIPTANDYMDFAISSDDIFSGTAGVIGIYVKLNSLGISGSAVFRANISGNGDNIKLVSLGDGEFRVLWDDSVSVKEILRTTTLSATTGMSYFFQITYSSTADAHELTINGTSYDTSTTAIEPISNLITLRLGETEDKAFDIYIDNVMTSDATTRDFYGEGLYDDTTSPR